MAAEEKWYFTKEQLANTPSRKCGFDADKELSSRQQAANFIQDMGQRLLVTQLCINTAIVYMHRFYMFHSFTRFHRNAMAAAALFLAAKVEEQPRKLEHVIKVAQICLHREQPPLDIKSEVYMEQAQELVVNENILLQTLGFDVAIDHPHTHVVRCCHLVRASKDLAQTSYFMASNSLHLTTMCLQYKPTVVACFCIHLACKWSNWEIPQSNEGRPWFWYVDKSVTQELLEQLTEEFLVIFEKCPSRLKKKIMSLSSSSQHSSILTAFNTPDQDKKRNGEGGSSVHQNSGPYQSSAPSSSSSNSSAGITSSSEDLKRKMEYSQRHHADYKKPHISHHSRNENAPNMSSKSSCMFGLPQRTQPPPSHAPGVVANTGSSNNIRASHKPPPPQDQRQRERRPEHHPQPYKKEQQHYFPQQPPTVEVPKPASVPPVPKVERSIFSPEVSTPEPKPEPILRIKEERVEEPPPPPPPPPPVIPPVTVPVIKEEKIEIKQELVEVKPPVEAALPPQVEEQHKEVKKKKKKHKEHKEKHKDKHKHKKEKHKEPGPIVITIPKDKLTTVPPIKEQSLKIKIAKDKITPITPIQQTSPVKLKIPKEKLKDSRKRERSESPGAATGTKRPNGAVQVTNLDLNEKGETDREGNSSIPDNSADHKNSTKNNNETVPKSVDKETVRQPFPNKVASSGSSLVSLAPHPRAPNFQSAYPRQHHRPMHHRGRGRMRPPRHAYYPPHFQPMPPIQPIYQPMIAPPFQYFFVPSYPPPPPLPDEPPPEPPPPPPPE